jgi:hypothetical protein
MGLQQETYENSIRSARNMASVTAESYASTSQEVLTITLDNLTPNQISDGENITGIELNINSSQIT